MNDNTMDSGLPMQCDYCGTRFHHPVAEAVKKGPDGKTACDICFNKTQEQPIDAACELHHMPLFMTTDCFYCGEDFRYRSDDLVPTYNEKPTCDACMVALKEANTTTIKAPAMVTSLDCEYCGQTIWLQEGDEPHTSEAGYTVCNKCERMIRHEHMAAMQRRVAEEANCNRARQGQDTESRICNAGRFVDRSMMTPAPYNLGTIILMASLNYDVRVNSVEREYEAILRQRPHGAEEYKPLESC